MKVNIGSDIVMQVDVNALPANALEHVIYIGLRNTLMDAHASVTEKTNPETEGRVAAKLAMAEKKWAALIAGDIRASGTRSRTSDPILARAIRIALEHVTAAWKKAGKEWNATAGREEAVAKVKANGAFREIAASQLRREAEDREMLALLTGVTEIAEEIAETGDATADADEMRAEELAA